MKKSLALCLAVYICAASTADAGAWLREKGKGFVSLSFGATQFSETTNAIYVEYGLSDSTTIGLDISTFTNANRVRKGFGTLFVRRSIGPTDRPGKWAYEMGIGGVWEDDKLRPAIKTGVSWGRGFEFKERSGWINIDGSFVYEPTLGEHITKIDTTVGMEIGQVTTGLLELTLSNQKNDNFGAIEPSVLVRPKRSKFDFKLGAQIPFDEQEKTALKLGIWRSF